MALAEVIKDVLFLRQVCGFMLPEVGMLCEPVLGDNERAKQLAKNPTANSNSKHNGVRHHVIREIAAREALSVVHVSSESHPANFRAKSLPVDSCESQCKFVMSLR